MIMRQEREAFKDRIEESIESNGKPVEQVAKASPAKSKSPEKKSPTKKSMEKVQEEEEE